MIVLMVVVDSLRADAPGFAGGGADTPFLDKMAKEGVVFNDMYASGAWTIPALMSMITGSYSHRVGIGRWRHPYTNGRPNLFTAFSAAGFEVSCFHPYPEWGFITIPGKVRVGNSQDPKEVIAALEGESGRDRFVLVHHWWTHLPYINRTLPLDKWHAACDFTLESLGKYPEKVTATVERTYLNTVSFFSEELLTKYMEAATKGGEEVLLVVTGDHGETFGESLPPGRRVNNVYDLHGRWITDETIKVPLVLNGTGANGALPEGVKLDGFARGIDVGPTIAELAGIPWPGPAPVLSGQESIERELSDLDIVGESMVPRILERVPSGLVEVMTLSSHNAHVPRTYPDNGLEMWRTFALRTEAHWCVWDGIAKERTIIPIDSASDPAPADADGIFKELEAQRQRAVDAGPGVSDERLDEIRGGVKVNEQAVVERLRTLGYLE